MLSCSFSKNVKYWTSFDMVSKKTNILEHFRNNSNNAHDLVALYKPKV